MRIICLHLIRMSKKFSLRKFINSILNIRKINNWLKIILTIDKLAAKETIIHPNPLIIIIFSYLTMRNFKPKNYLQMITKTIRLNQIIHKINNYLTLTHWKVKSYSNNKITFLLPKNYIILFLKNSIF